MNLASQPYNPPVIDMGRYWMIRDYTLFSALGVATNYCAQDAVGREVERQGLDPTRFEFDSELGCFFAYAKTKADIDRLAELIGELVAKGPNPDAVPGWDIEDSPMYFGR